jgi:predicted RNase H-like HicB family nuclease
MGKRYTVAYERDEDGFWTAVIEFSRGKSAIADGRSIGEARKRIRGALAVYLDDEKAAAEAELVDDVKLPAGLKGELAKAVRIREEADAAQERAIETSAAVARKLAAAGISTRDAAGLLGVSHQLVHKYGLISRADAERVAEATAVGAEWLEGRTAKKARATGGEKLVGERLRAAGGVAARRGAAARVAKKRAAKRVG